MAPGPEQATRRDWSATRAERERRVVAAVHSGEMEGLQVSRAARAELREYVEGRISVDDLVARGRARYGLD